MTLESQCHDFIDSPYPLWETALSTTLANQKWSQLGISPGTYSTTNIWHKKQLILRPAASIIHVKGHQVLLEQADHDHLMPFYKENGLEVLSVNDMIYIKAKQKLHESIGLLNTIGQCGECIAILVKSIQVLKQPAPEYDVSYSHPDIPFSIFVSVGTEETLIATLRLAESILHEAMHLKLTLFEENLPIIKPQSAGTFYSPWREEPRPIRGVLHGLFVFRAILDFYKGLLLHLTETDAKRFADYRIEVIMQEFSMIKALPSAPGITEAGKQLAINLLQY